MNRTEQEQVAFAAEAAQWSRLVQAGGDPVPEVVRSVDDLADGDRVHLWDEEWEVTRGIDTHLQLTHTTWPHLPPLETDHVALAVAAGAVTRIPEPEPDPAEVDRLLAVIAAAPFMEERDLSYADAVVFAKHLVRNGVRAPGGTE